MILSENSIPFSERQPLKVLPRTWRIDLLTNALKALESFDKVDKISYPTKDKFEAVVKFNLDNNDTSQIRKIKLENGQTMELKEYDVILDFEKNFGGLIGTSKFVNTYIESQGENPKEYHRVFNITTTINNNILILRG